MVEVKWLTSQCSCWVSGSFPSVLSGRTSSHNWLWPEKPCSWIRAVQFPRSGRPKRGNWESFGGKMYAHVLNLSIETGQNRFFSAGQTGQMESDLNKIRRYHWFVSFRHMQVKSICHPLQPLSRDLGRSTQKNLRGVVWTPGRWSWRRRHQERHAVGGSTSSQSSLRTSLLRMTVSTQVEYVFFAKPWVNCEAFQICTCHC